MRLTKKEKSSLVRAYEKMLQEEYHKGEVKPNHVNCYVCENCGQITKTIDIEKGTTPFMIDCTVDGCGGLAKSSFYNDLSPTLKPSHEWFRPSLKATLRQQRGMIDHIVQGGLELRKIA